MRAIVCVMAWQMVVCATMTAQEPASKAMRSGKRALLPRDAEITLARSAAPASISADATVLVMTDSGFVSAKAGSNGVTCVVNRSWPRSLEPHCFDAEASATILPIELKRTMLLHRGGTVVDVDREIDRALSAGELRVPRRPAMSYMMSAVQQLIGDDGQPAGRWRPHLMIYYPYLVASDVGFGRVPDMSVGMVSEAGRPTANITIIMATFVEPTPSVPVSR
jgi:hypothetical protein